jgi:hypothetical protein
MVREVKAQTVWWLIAIAMVSILPVQGAGGSLAKLVDAVLRNGPNSQLPAHLSVVLGVSRLEQATPVKQAVMRNGSVVRTFNVCTAHHDDIVLITYDEQSRSSKAYLVSPAGALRKAVSYQAGAPASERSLTDAARDFANEIKFWTDLENAPGGPK